MRYSSICLHQGSHLSYAQDLLLNRFQQLNQNEGGHRNHSSQRNVRLSLICSDTTFILMSAFALVFSIFGMNCQNCVGIRIAKGENTLITKIFIIRSQNLTKIYFSFEMMTRPIILFDVVLSVVPPIYPGAVFDNVALTLCPFPLAPSVYLMSSH